MRSSPGPKTGCSHRQGVPRHRVRGVAILTRSEDRVQRHTMRPWRPTSRQLRSSPGPKTGCSLIAGRLSPDRRGLRSSPGPKTGCSLVLVVDVQTLAVVAILTRSEDRVQPPHHRWATTRPRVAILTRSEDRVQRMTGRAPTQASAWLRSSPGPKTGCSCHSSTPRTSHCHSCDPHPVRRPGAATISNAASCSRSCCDPHPVRRPGAATHLTPNQPDIHRLRSSPGPKTGCSLCASARSSIRAVLRSSPGPKTGCSTCWPRRRPPVRTGCDPHPVRRPGAASSRWGTTPRPTSLRSSPGPKTGCSSDVAQERGPAAAVAILTRSEDRVQHRSGVGDVVAGPLRSSPGPKTGCSVAHQRLIPTPTRVAILTRSEDRVQLVHLAASLREIGVAILTRSEDRVQRPARMEWPVRRMPLRSSPGPKTGCSLHG